MRQKTLSIVTIVLVVLAVGFLCIFMFEPEVFGISESGSSPDYVKYFDPDKVTTVNLTISEENWQDMLANPTAEEWHLASAEINGDVYDGIAIRTKGMTSLSQVASSDSDRYSFKLKGDEYVTGQTFAGLNKFVLNNNYQDPTSMREYLSYELLTKLGVPTPLYAYAAVYINGEYWGLYLMIEEVEDDFLERNYGKNFGKLYKPESMDFGGGKDEKGGRMQMPEGFGDEELAQFAQMSDEEREAMMQQFRNQGQNGQNMQNPPDMQNMQGMPDMTGMPDMQNMQPPSGNFPGGNFSGKDMPGGNMPGGGGPGGMGKGADLVYTDDEYDSYSTIFDGAVLNGLKKADKERVITALKHLSEGTDLETYIDVDEVLRYFAVNTAIVNLDSYVSSLQHNYYLYEKDGKLSMLPWDWNLAFGAFQTNTSGAVNFPIDTPVTSGIELSDRPMIGSLLAVDSYKETYHWYLSEICEYMENTMPKRIDEIESMISPYVKADPTAFYTYEEHVSGVENLKKYIALRAQSIRGQLNGTIPSTWDGQNADSSALVDAGDLVISGGMGGGGGFGGGNFPGQGHGRQGGENPPARP
ncbi:MAG TPA: CotH kinase family protein [Methanocorpusculum sp.]|nr:CotH kinase family protein [Methanocorpusculum sp.]